MHLANKPPIFYRHLRDPQQPNQPCRHCNKPCLLYEDPNRRDEQLINQIRERNVATRQAEQEEQPPAAPEPEEDGSTAETESADELDD